MCTTPLERIIHRHNLCYHKYADDMEIYGEYDPSSNCDCLWIRHQMEACLDEIRAGMLFTNPKLAKSLQEAGTPVPSIVLCDNTITAESAIRNLGVILDSNFQVSATLLRDWLSGHGYRVGRLCTSHQS